MVIYIEIYINIVKRGLNLNVMLAIRLLLKLTDSIIMFILNWDFSYLFHNKTLK